MKLLDSTLLMICCILVGVSARAYHQGLSERQVDDVDLFPANRNDDDDANDQSDDENDNIVSDRAFNSMNDDSDDDEQLERRAPHNSQEQRAFDLTNQARRTGRYCGSTWCPAVSALGWNDQLADAARKHAQDMRDKNYFSHNSLDGRTPWTRIKNAGYNCGSLAENIAGNSNADAVVASWLKSPGHCVNIMSANKRIGIGMASGGPYGGYWVQAFGGC